MDPISFSKASGNSEQLSEIANQANQLHLVSAFGNTKTDIGKLLRVRWYGTHLWINRKISATQSLLCQWAFESGSLNLPFGFLRDWLCNDTQGYIPNVWPETSTLINNANGTDWIGPYIVRALNNIDGDSLAVDSFTGGWHCYSGNIIGGTKTAEIESPPQLTVYNGNTAKTIGGVENQTNALCDRAVVKWTNLVQAWNTKKEDGSGRNVLREHLTVTFVEGYTIVENTIEALEDIEIDKYYGLQGCFSEANNGTNPSMFIDGVDTVEAPWQLTNKNSVTKGNGGKCDAFLLRRIDLGFNYSMFIDSSVGIGNREHLKDTDSPFFFVAAIDKVYAHLISKPTRLNKGETSKWRGGYRLYKNEY